MRIHTIVFWLSAAWLAVLCAPAYATVQIVSLAPTLASPQPIGTPLDWTAVATDSNPGPLTFQYNVAPPDGTFMTVRQFNVGPHTGSTWQSLPFAWSLTGMDGTYQVQVVAKDFTSGETASKTVSFTVTTPLTGNNPVVQATANPLVALFIAHSCPAGSGMRVSFQAHSGNLPANTTNWISCHPPTSMTFEIAGMYPSTTYNMYAEVETGGTVTDGPTVSFTTGALPPGISFPTFTVGIPAPASDPNRLLLHTLFDETDNITYPNVATDLSGNIMWYSYPDDTDHASIITRSLANGYLAIQNGPTWIPDLQEFQVLRQLDWAGNVLRETNTGIIEQQVLALGDPDAQPCNTIPSPPPVGAACIGLFHHDAIQTLANGYTAAFVDVERIFPPGTQGDTSGLPVDIVGDIIVVLDQNWNAVWYWDAFDPLDGGNGYPQLPVSRPAVLNEECIAGESSCEILFLLGPGVSPAARDWLHGNSLYYWPNDGAAPPVTQPGDIIWSSRHQDWVMRIDYQDGAGTGNILWRMGPSGDFEFENIYNDPWPWFSHQHDVGIEDGGLGVVSVFDNGNTRVSPPGMSTGGVPGLGKHCKPNDCNNRGMALSMDEAALEVTPVMSVNLGVFSDAMGSAQLLADGNYFFQPATVVIDDIDYSYAIEIVPTPGTDSGTQVLNLAGPGAYRSWQMPNLYEPPTT